MSEKNEPSEAEQLASRHRPLFAPWANSAIRLALALGLASLVALPTFFIAWARTPYSTGASDPIVQPVMFDHRHHYRDDGIDCRYCHYAVDRSPYAGVPATEVCMNCHSQVWNDAPLLSRVRASFFSGKPIEWERVNALPDHVFFNHAVHVNRGVGCVTCHGRVDLMGQVYQATPLTMEWCLDCHRAPARYLRPQEQITNMEWTPDRPQAELGLAIEKERTIAPPTHCSACHR